MALKIMNLPLLQSIYVETMRVHLSMNIMREIMEPITMDGYDLKPGAWCFLPMEISHLDESWGVNGHPATEFWAARHIIEEEKIDQLGDTVRKATFRLSSNKSGAFFPYGMLEFPLCNLDTKASLNV
ncbi:hypothetical protein N0V82_004109 [Gnomoniopsis sp. IMI 355080]|nr:hypothetical protein N0V82_004109 [Gnomoniopsis sp. IMI 355080]